MKSKKIIAAALCGIICASLCGCGSEPAASNPQNNSTAQSANSANSANGSSSADSAASGNESNSTASGSESNGAASGSDNSENSAAASGNPYSDPKNPAPLGEWIEAATYNPISKKQETIYWRIVSVDQNGQPSVDAYNSGRHVWELKTPKEDFIKYFEVTYEIKYPEDYPANERGISSSELSGLYAENPNGGGFEKDGTAYIGLGQCFDCTSDVMSKPAENPKPGDTETRKAVFTMMADNPDYVFRYYFEGKNGGTVYTYAASR